MPTSDCHLDTPTDLVRVRCTAYTGDLRGVVFVDGVAQGPMSRVVAERLLGILGREFAIVGPWEVAAVPAPPTTPPTPPAPIKPTKPTRVR